MATTQSYEREEDRHCDPLLLRLYAIACAQLCVRVAEEIEDHIRECPWCCAALEREIVASCVEQSPKNGWDREVSAIRGQGEDEVRTRNPIPGEEGDVDAASVIVSADSSEDKDRGNHGCVDGTCEGGGAAGSEGSELLKSDEWDVQEMVVDDLVRDWSGGRYSIEGVVAFNSGLEAHAVEHVGGSREYDDEYRDRRKLWHVNEEQADGDHGEDVLLYTYVIASPHLHRRLAFKLDAHLSTCTICGGRLEEEIHKMLSVLGVGISESSVVIARDSDKGMSMNGLRAATVADRVPCYDRERGRASDHCIAEGCPTIGVPQPKDEQGAENAEQVDVRRKGVVLTVREVMVVPRERMERGQYVVWTTAGSSSTESTLDDHGQGGATGWVQSLKPRVVRDGAIPWSSFFDGRMCGSEARDSEGNVYLCGTETTRRDFVQQATIEPMVAEQELDASMTRARKDSRSDMVKQDGLLQEEGGDRGSTQVSDEVGPRIRREEDCGNGARLLFVWGGTVICAQGRQLCEGVHGEGTCIVEMCVDMSCAAAAERVVLSVGELEVEQRQDGSIGPPVCGLPRDDSGKADQTDSERSHDQGVTGYRMWVRTVSVGEHRLVYSAGGIEAAQERSATYSPSKGEGMTRYAGLSMSSDDMVSRWIACEPTLWVNGMEFRPLSLCGRGVDTRRSLAGMAKKQVEVGASSMPGLSGAPRMDNLDEWIWSRRWRRLRRWTSRRRTGTG